MRVFLLILTLAALLAAHGTSVASAEPSLSLLFSANSFGTFKPCPS